MHDVQKLIIDIKNSAGYWEETSMLDFAVMLNEEMRNQNISNSQLAKKIGVSKSYISKILGGENVNFTLKSMAKFMFALGKRLHFYCTPISQESHVNSGEVCDWLFTHEKTPDLSQQSLMQGSFAVQSAKSIVTFQNKQTDKIHFDESRIAA